MVLLALSLLASDMSFGGDITSIAVASDGKVALGKDNGLVQVLDSRGHEKASFIERGRVTALCFAPDGKRLATGFQDEGEDVTTGIWTSEGTNIRYFDAFKRRPPSPKDRMRMYSVVTTYALAWSPNGKYIAAGRGGHLNTGVRVWDMQGHLVSELGRNAKVGKGQRPPMASGVHGLNFSPDGRAIVTSMDDGYVRLWNLDGSLKWERNLSARDSVIDADFSTSGEQIVWGTSWEDRLVGSLDSASGKVRWTKKLSNYPHAILGLGGDRLLAAFDGGAVMASKTEVKTLIPADRQVSFFHLSPDRRSLVAVTKRGEILRMNVTPASRP